MTRVLWLAGTIAVGTAIAVSSWFFVRELPAKLQAAQPPAGPNAQTAPAGRNNVNDQEAPPAAEESVKGDTFIGTLRGLLEDSPDMGPEFREHGESLEQAEETFERIQRENKQAWQRVNRRPPLSIPQSPNFVLIDAPGLGFADLATFSNEVEAELAIDKFAKAGLVFTHYYAASPSPAANSNSILTAFHTGRTRIRGSEPQVPLTLDDITLAEVLWRAGYSTAMLGQWRLGGATTSGGPTRQGFEEAWFTDAHAADGELVVWDGTERVKDDDQPEDLAGFRESMIHRSVGFFDRHRQQPVFLYLSFPVDGVDSAESVTELSKELERLTKAVHEMKLPRETYFFLAGSAGENIPASQAPRIAVATAVRVNNVPLVPMPPVAEQAAIIPGAKAPEQRPAPESKIIETEVAPETVAEEVPRLESEENDGQEAVPKTEFTQPRPIEGAELLQMNTARELAGLRGTAGDLFEGGLRAPLIVWTTHRPLGGIRHDVVAAWDFLPTLAGLSYAQFVPTHVNGVPFSDRLQVHGETSHLPLHPALYWENHADGFSRSVLFGKWKLIQVGEDGSVALYNLETDPRETQDVSEQQRELVEKLVPLLDRVRTKSRHWPREGERFPEKPVANE